MKSTRTLRAGFAVIIALGLSSLGFQCSSPNITSGKLYYQQYESTKDTTKLNQSLEAFQREVQEKPNSAEAWYWLGFIHGVKKDYIRLHEAWQKSKQLGSQMQGDMNSNRLYFWGQAYNNGANVFRKAQIKKDKALYEEAEKSFRAATLLEPDSSAKYGGFVNLAYALIAQNRNADAIEPLTEQNRLAPNPDAYKLSAQLLLDEGNALKEGNPTAANAKYEKAITLLNEGLTKFPDDAGLNQELLNAYIAANRIVEAKSKFKQYADGNPQDKAAQYAYGTVLLETKNYQEATTYLQKAIVLDAKYENALYNICVTYLRWGIEVRDNTDPNATSSQASAFKEIIEKAVPHVKSLLDIDAKNSAYWDLAGRVYASLGKTKEATEAYNKADDLRKGN